MKITVLEKNEPTTEEIIDSLIYKSYKAVRPQAKLLTEEEVSIWISYMAKAEYLNLETPFTPYFEKLDFDKLEFTFTPDEYEYLNGPLKDEFDTCEDLLKASVKKWYELSSFLISSIEHKEKDGFKEFFEENPIEDVEDPFNDFARTYALEMRYQGELNGKKKEKEKA